MRLALLTGSLALAAPPVPDVPRPSDTLPPVKAAPLTAAEEARRDALARYGVGLIRARHDQIATAAKQFEAAARQTPDAAAPQKELAKLYAELGREPAAARAGEKALAADPHDLATARLLGRLYADAQRWPDGVRVLRLAAASKELTDPVSKLMVLKDLAKAADAANDPAAAAARTDALAVLKEHRATFLTPDLFTLDQLERERARLYEGLGNALVRKQEHAAAVAAFEAARDLCADPKAANDPAGVARLHWNLSAVRLAEREPVKALAEVEKYLAFKPAGFEPYERFVRVMKQLKRADELPAKLAELAEADPNNRAPQWLAAVESLPTDPDTAHKLFRNLAAKGTAADGYRVLATAYRDANRPKELLDLLDKAYTAARPPEGDGKKDGKKDDKPANPDALARARLLTDAVKRLNPPFTRRLVGQVKSEEGSGRHADTLELLLGLAVRDGELEAMAGVLERAAMSRKKEYELKALAVAALAQQREWSRLAAVCNELSNSDDGRFYPTIRLQKAVAYAEQGKREQALAVFSKDGDLRSLPSSQAEQVRILNILGDHADALAGCDTALKNDTLTAGERRSLLVQKVHTLNHLKKHAEAEAILRELLDADPDDVLLLNNLGYELADQNRKLEEAETLVRRAIDLDRWERGRRGDPEAESGGYADSLGWVLFRRGKLKEAREQLEKAVASPEASADGIVWDHLGDCAFRQGDKRRAAEAWRQAAKWYEKSHTGRELGRLDEAKAKLKLAE